VTLGDSITDGFGSTPDTNQRWPNILTERLRSHRGTSRVAVLNAAIIGNRVLHDLVGTNALARLDRDVLVQSGVKYVIVMEGVNDFGIPGLIGNPAERGDCEQVIQGHRQIIDRAHALGLRIYGATFESGRRHHLPQLLLAALEAKRGAVNHWIRTSRAYDAVIDFRQGAARSEHPTRILRRMTAAITRIPTISANRAMADAIDLSLFRADDEN